MTADPDLVAYLRKHWKRFGPEALRQKLLEEGVDEEEVTSALAEAAPKPGRSLFSRLLYLVLSAASLASMGYWAWRDNPPAAGKKPSRQIIIQENPNDPHQAFLGHYGYILRLPLGYTALSDFKNPEKTIEVVYLFPKGTDANNLLDEGLYAPLGILRLEVSPHNLPEGRPGLALVRSEVAASLQQHKAAYSMREAAIGGLPAVVVNVQAPEPRAKAFVIGSKVLYVFTGGPESQLFMDALLSLHELSPRDKPGGQ